MTIEQADASTRPAVASARPAVASARTEHPYLGHARFMPFPFVIRGSTRRGPLKGKEKKDGNAQSVDDLPAVPVRAYSTRSMISFSSTMLKMGRSPRVCTRPMAFTTSCPFMTWPKMV